jgi:hypothetical protein
MHNATGKQQMTSTTPSRRPDVAPISQERVGYRSNWPEWVRQLPSLRFPEDPNPHFQLIDEQEFAELLRNVEPAVVTRIQQDMQFLDKELMRLFRQRDYEAKVQQNRYRLYRLAFSILAVLAALIGTLALLALAYDADLAVMLVFAETFVALLTTYVVTVSGREPPMALWMENRKRAEFLRREYFRFLLNLPPYENLLGHTRRQTLSQRAADINRGVLPVTDTID